MRYPLLRDPEAQADAANHERLSQVPSTAGCGRSDETGLNRRAVGAYSRDVRIPTAFVARKGNPGFGWAVDVLWPMARRKVVKDFATEQQAAEWIAKHSEG
jgi:hypothetical protein